MVTLMNKYSVEANSIYSPQPIEFMTRASPSNTCVQN